MDSNSKNRKRKTITLAEKQEIIEASKIKKISELSGEFNLPLSTIRTIIKDEHRISEALNKGKNGMKSKMKGARYPDLEEALLLWLKQVRTENVLVNGPLLKEKAVALAIVLNIDGFNASNGWLNNFKRRNGIDFKETQDEAADAVADDTADYCPNILFDFLNGDQDLITNDTLSLEEIAATSGANTQKESHSHEEEAPTTTESLPFVTLKDAYQAFNTLRKYVEENGNDSKIMESCHQIEEFLYSEQRKKDVQANLDQFFS